MQELETALRNADAAGDTQAAKMLAGEIIKMRESGTAPEPQPTAEPTAQPQDEWDYSGAVPQRKSEITTPKEDRTLGEIATGVGETALALGTGATTGAAGQIYGTLKGLAEQILSGEFGSKEAAQKIRETAEQFGQEFTYEPRGEAGQEYTKKAAELLTGAEALTPLAGEMQALAGGLKAPQKGKLIKEELRSYTPETKKQYKQIIKEDPTNKAVAKYELIGDRVRFDTEASEAIKQGFEDRVIASIKASSPEDRKNMLKMLNVHKLGQKSAKFAATNRPADVMGKSLENRIKYIADTKKQAGKELETAANGLKGTKVNYDDAVGQFLTDLDDMGVKVWKEDDKLKISLRGSDVEGDVASQQLLNKIFNRLVHTDVPDGYGIHKAKRFIDTQVSYGKTKANPLSKSTERIVKGLRRNLNEALNNYSESYKNANEKYRDSLTALEDIQKAAGTKVDLDSPNVDKALGGSMRKVLSNYGSRVEMIDALDKVDSVAKKYGMEPKDDLINQVIFVNEVDRMFGSPAPTSFKGQISQAISRGIDIPRRGLHETAIDLAKEGIEKARGINEENALKSIEKVLRKSYGGNE